MAHVDHHAVGVGEGEDAEVGAFVADAEVEAVGTAGLFLVVDVGDGDSGRFDFRCLSPDAVVGDARGSADDGDAEDVSPDDLGLDAGVAQPCALLIGGMEPGLSARSVGVGVLGDEPIEAVVLSDPDVGKLETAIAVLLDPAGEVVGEELVGGSRVSDVVHRFGIGESALATWGLFG
nr:hypothetical protein [Ruania alba]